MAKNRRFDQVEAVRQNVGAQKRVHRVQLNEYVGQEHDLERFTISSVNDTNKQR